MMAGFPNGWYTLPVALKNPKGIRKHAMKKRFLLALLLLTTLASLFAAGGTRNLQKIYPVDSDVYKAIRYLYVSQGMALPSTTGPWSADELLKMLDKIDRSKLAPGAAATYDFAVTTMDEGHKAVKFGLKAAVEGYYNSDTVNFTKESQWIRGFDDRNPVLDIILETWPSEHFYGYSSLSVGNNRYNGWGNDGATSTFFGQETITTNLPMVPPAVMNDLDFNIPYRAFGSIGGDGWSAQIGRDKLSWGPGESGNFVLGDHILYHNVGRLTTYGKNFKYSFATSFFPHPQNYYTEANGIMDSSGNISNRHGQDDIISGLNMFISHRLEGRIFNNKVGIALTEAIMYQSTNNTLDLFILSPTAIFHNYYIRHNANSIISFEVDYSPIKSVNIYGQMVVDEFALPGEPVPGDTRWGSALPNGYGFMVGTKIAKPFAKGMLFGSAEWAKTDPYLYLRDNGDRNQDLGEYGINWIVASREFSNGSGITYTEEFLGYKYGGDAIVLNANAGFKKFGSWSIEGNVFYMTHGTHDKWTTWAYVESDPNGTVPNVETPTTEHYTPNNGDLDADDRDCVSKTFVVGARGSYTILKGLNAFVQADYIHVTNPGNISTNPAIQDVQVTIGVKYSL
jgi:hypothetical protein